MTLADVASHGGRVSRRSASGARSYGLSMAAEGISDVIRISCSSLSFVDELSSAEWIAVLSTAVVLQWIH